MDNFFQVLIYLIIIIAFLSSIFKKKDKEKPSYSSRETDPNSPEPKSGQESQQGEYDILKEIEGLFKTETSVHTEKPKLETAIKSAEKRKAADEEHLEDKEWHELSPKEHELAKSWHTISPFKRTVKIDSTMEKEAEKFEHILESLHREDDFAYTELREKLFSVQSLREFIIMSEILGKPKYLRR